MADRPESKNEYYIAYCDILGVSDRIKNNPIGLVEDLKGVYSFASRMIKMHYDISDDEPEIKMKIFSDNVLVLVDGKSSSDTQKIVYLILFLAFFQEMAFSVHGFTMRGAICYGEINFEEDFVIGPALVKAYKLESSCAVYPRIIMEKMIAEKFISYRKEQPGITKFVDIQMDTDGIYYVDYIHVLIRQSKGKKISAYDCITKAINESGANLQNDLHLAQKYDWIKKKIDKAKKKSHR